MLQDTTRLDFPASGIAEIPFTFEPQVLRCAAAGPGGRPLTVLLDTGTDPSAIDLTLAQRLGLRLGEFALGQTANSDTVPFTETVLPWLRLGNLTLRDLFMLAVDLRPAPFQVDMVLGYNVLQQIVLRIDYTQHRLHISHPDLGVPSLSESSALMGLTFFEHFPALTNITLDTALCLPQVTIDTGSNGGVTLGPDLAAQIGLQRNAAAVVATQGMGFSGSCEILVGRAASMQVGPFALQNVQLDTLSDGAGDLRRAGRANIGNRLLARFASVTLDYGRRLCVLEPSASAVAQCEPDVDERAIALG